MPGNVKYKLCYTTDLVLFVNQSNLPPKAGLLLLYPFCCRHYAPRPHHATIMLLPPHGSSKGYRRERARRLFELLAEEDELDLVVDGEHTSTSDTTEDVGTSTLEERLDTLSSDDLATGIEGRLVLDGLHI